MGLLWCPQGTEIVQQRSSDLSRQGNHMHQGDEFPLKVSAWISRNFPALHHGLLWSWPLSGLVFPSVKKRVLNQKITLHYLLVQAFSDLGLGILLLQKCFLLQLMSSN